VAKSPIVQTSAVVLSPDQFQLYGNVQPDLPNQVMTSIRESRREEFIYATLSLTYGIVGFALVVSLAYRLALQGHEKTASWMLGSGAVSIIIGFIQARLRGQQFKTATSRKARKSKTALAEVE